MATIEAETINEALITRDEAAPEAQGGNTSPSLSGQLARMTVNIRIESSVGQRQFSEGSPTVSFRP